MYVCMYNNTSDTLRLVCSFKPITPRVALLIGIRYIFNTYSIDNILTIKILFTIDSLKKKSISSKHYLQFFSLKKTLSHFIKNISIQLKQFISNKKEERINYFQGQLHSY